jgi:hypothetical protein
VAGYTPDTNVALTFDTALTPQAQATSMADGIIIGMVPGSNTAPVRFKGTASGVDEIEIRIRRQSGGVVLDWTPVAVAQNGVWDGVLDLPKADDWWAADARPKHTPTAVQSISHKFAVGYKFMWLGQSQMSIVAKTNEGISPLLDETADKASYYSWQDYNVGGQYSEAEQLFVLGASNPGADGVRSFVKQFRVFDPDTPIQVFRESVNGSSILEMLDDDEPRRSWTDLTDKTDKYGGDISVVLESWNSSNTGLFDGYQDLDMLNGIDTYGYAIEHTLPEVLQPGYVYAVQPATRRAKLTGDINHAASKIARAHVLGYPVGLPIPDYELEDFGGHALKDSQANVIMGSRMALLAARAVGYATPANPSFLPTATLSDDSTIITLTPVLPNGGQLFSPAPDDLRMFAVDFGTGLTTEGFTARIAANGMQVELVRTAGSVWAAPQFLKVQVYANGHLNPDLSGSGQTGTAWRAIEEAVIAGQLYETYPDDVVGLGLPVAGVVVDGNWQIPNTSVPLVPVVTQNETNTSPPPATSAFSLLSADAQADTTVAGAAEGYKRERFVADAFVEDGVLPASGSKYLIGAFQISAIAGTDKFFDQIEVRNAAGYALGETLEIASINQAPGGQDMRVQVFVHTDTGVGQHLYAKSSGRQLMSYLPVYKINGFTTTGAVTATSLTGDIDLTGVPQGAAIVAFAQNRDGTAITWGGVVEDGAHSLNYAGDDRYQAVASGVVGAGGDMTVIAEGAEEMVVIVLPPV